MLGDSMTYIIMNAFALNGKNIVHTNVRVLRFVLSSLGGLEGGELCRFFHILI